MVKTRWCWIAVLLGSTFLMGARAEGAVGNLKVELKTDPGPHALGVPVFATQVIRNQGAEAMVVDWLPHGDLQVAPEGGEFTGVGYRDLIDEIVAQFPDTMPPGAARSGARMVLWFKGGQRMDEKRALVFPRPGVYRLRVIWTVTVRQEGGDVRVQLTSNEEQVRVTEKLPGYDEFLGLMQRVVFSDLSWPKDAMGEVEGFIAAHPEGVYSACAKALVLQHWCREKELQALWTELLKSERLTDLAKAVLKDIGPGGGQMKEFAYYTLAAGAYCRWHTGPEAARPERLKEAEKWIAEFEKEIVKSPLLDRARTMPDRLKAARFEYRGE
jgi:hypothetical protein